LITGHTENNININNNTDWQNG